MERLLDQFELAAILGVRPAQVRRMVRDRAVPMVELPCCSEVRFLASEIAEWIGRLKRTGGTVST